jgi:peptidoglycan/LPS O-acetylase OafA/YrhL
VNASPGAPDVRHPTLRYLPGLDGLRALSVLAVLVFHHYVIGGHEAGWLPGGFLGVEVFFVVSGYLITSLLLAERRDSGEISLRRFWMRRARRLLPALGALLAVVVAYALVFLPDAIGTLRSDVVAALTYTSNWWQIIAHRSYFVDAGRPALLKHLWSLAIEEQFYLLWPPLLIVGLRRLGRDRMLGVVLTVAIASAVAMALLASSTVDGTYYATYTRLSGLLLGAGLAFVFAPYRIRGIPGHGARIALDVGGAVGLFLLYASFRRFTYPESTGADLAVFRGGFLLVDVATILVIASAVHPASDVGRLLGWRPLKEVGLRSYSLYLWHYPIYCVTRPGLDFANFLHLRGWPVFALRLGLSLAAADLSYRYVERPIRNGALGRYRAMLRDAYGRRKQRLARRGITVAGSLALVAVMLGAGLASAQPSANAIPGISEAAHKDDHGDVADSGALDALLGHQTTASTGKGVKPPAGGHTTTTTTPRRPTLPHVLAIGDSVMLGAQRALQTAIPGIVVDAKVSRQFWDAIVVMAFYAKLQLIPPAVVIHSGTNGRITGDMFDQMMRTIGSAHQVYFLTARVPRPWEAEVNSTLAAGVKRWKNAHLLDWRHYAGCHDDWFVIRDGFHLEPPGQLAYAAFVRAGVTGNAQSKCVK